ncbi:MAG: very short patch repair endonuclease [Deltaproteobacteria bacterium]|nr:very short patch repair endonuclease [Deltaproteobacteria bacterium]
MADVLTPEQRSFCMSRIKGRDTKPELAIRKALWSLGYRYRVDTKLPGKPDMVFPGKRLAVFIDGCFWHRCPRHYQTPATNPEFWENKINRNVERDRMVDRELASMGWKVKRVWEHEVREDPLRVIEDLIQMLKAAGQKSSPKWRTGASSPPQP